jgi:hypothetical protein
LFQKDFGLPEGYEYDIYCPSEQLDLRDLVLAFQHHDKNHRSSCFRDGCDYCRYHFPWHLRVATVILMLKQKGKKHYALQTLVRRNNRWINNYIPWVLMHYRANMDWKFITSTTGTAIYSCMYSSKAEAPDKKLINAKIWKHLAADEQNGLQGDTRKLVYLASMAVHNSKQSGAQEAANEALGNRIVSSTHRQIKLCLLPSHLKQRQLKSSFDLSQLNDESNDVFEKESNIVVELMDYMSLINKKEHLEGLSFYSFVVWYRKSKLNRKEKKCLKNLTNSQAQKNNIFFSFFIEKFFVFLCKDLRKIYGQQRNKGMYPKK